MNLLPDQFNVLSSPHEEVNCNTIKELEYQVMLAVKIGADVINLHRGGVYGNKKAAPVRFEKNFRQLSKRVRSHVPVENDDSSYSPADLLALCRNHDIAIDYDVHHHRCNPDTLSQEEATMECVKTWDND